MTKLESQQRIIGFLNEEFAKNVIKLIDDDYKDKNLPYTTFNWAELWNKLSKNLHNHHVGPSKMLENKSKN